MISLHEIFTAYQMIQPYLGHAPLRFSPALSEQSGAKVWLKLENQQPTGSFKIRGALHKIMRLSPEQRRTGLVTASAGNHGLGTAYAAQALGLAKVTIFVPQNAPQAKVAKLNRFPVRLQQVGDSYEAAHQAAEQFAQASGASYIPAYDDPLVISGAGTCGLEIMQGLPAVEVIIVPVGGGGLVAGVAVAAKKINPACHIIGVQPAASPAAKLSLAQNMPLDPFDHAPTLADGLAGGFGAHPFYLARTLVEDILLFSEAALRQAIFTLVAQEQLIVEASGAIAIAPLLAGNHPFQGKTVVCILTGANIDSPVLAAILQEFTVA
jgi:threonine dehydratase